METRRSSLPLLVAGLALLLPLALYIGSYFALVAPAGSGYLNGQTLHYRFAPTLAQRFYWPLEQIDRQARPNAWHEIHWTPVMLDVEDMR